jgi:hypothetical protein
MTPLRILLALAITALCSCASPQLARVKPWQRGNLAKPVMQPDREGMATTMAEHVFFSREASHGGGGVGGGGCGCN